MSVTNYEKVDTNSNWQSTFEICDFGQTIGQFG